MRLLFVHDHVFFSSIDGRMFSAAAYPSAIWERYLKFFSEVTVIGRYGGVCSSAEESLVLSEHKDVKFELVKKLAIGVSVIRDYRSNLMSIDKQVDGCDALIARLPSENGLAALLSAKRHSKPFVIEVVGCVWDALWNHGSIIAKIYAPVAFLRMRRAIRQSSKTIYVTTDFLQKRYPSSRNSVTISASNVEILNVSNTFVDFSQSEVVFGLIGNFKTEYKGIHIAIKALGIVNKQFPNFQFRVLGKGDPVPYIKLGEKCGIQDKVVFCGSLPNGGPVIEWLDNINIYLQPSLTEGLPRSLLEAMSRGRPCLGSTVGGIPELLERKYLHRQGDYRHLARQIIEMLTSKELDQIAEANLKKAENYLRERIEVKRNSVFSKLRTEAETIRMPAIGFGTNERACK